MLVKRLDNLHKIRGRYLQEDASFKKLDAIEDATSDFLQLRSGKTCSKITVIFPWFITRNVDQKNLTEKTSFVFPANKEKKAGAKKDGQMKHLLNRSANHLGLKIYGRWQRKCKTMGTAHFSPKLRVSIYLQLRCIFKNQAITIFKANNQSIKGYHLLTAAKAK